MKRQNATNDSYAKKTTEKYWGDETVEMFFDLLRCVDLIHIYSRVRAKQLDSTTTRWLIWEQLVKHVNISNQNGLSEIIHRSKQSISKVVDQMVKQGTVKRHANENDRRETTISVTKNGFKRLELSFQLRNHIAKQAFSSLCKRDRQQLRNILKKLIPSMERQIVNIRKDRNFQRVVSNAEAQITGTRN